jgi:hypothetical protein
MTSHELFELLGVKNNYGQPQGQWCNYLISKIENDELKD